MIYGSWNISCNRHILLSFWAISCHFSTLTTHKIKILKLKKIPGDIIILQICITHDNYMIYGSWDMVRHRQNFLSFWTVFCPFTPLWTQKIKILKKLKKHLKILPFTNVHHKWQPYDVRFLWYEAWWTEFFIILVRFLPFYPPNNPKIQNFEKLKKTPRDIILLHMCTINNNHNLSCHDGPGYIFVIFSENVPM